MVTLQVLGVEPIQRNAILALAHFNEVGGIFRIEKVARTDERPMIEQLLIGPLVKFLGKKQEILSMLIMIKRMQKFRMK